jgi:hypothetical protein
MRIHRLAIGAPAGDAMLQCDSCSVCSERSDDSHFISANGRKQWSKIRRCNVLGISNMSLLRWVPAHLLTPAAEQHDVARPQEGNRIYVAYNVCGKGRGR